MKSLFVKNILFYSRWSLVTLMYVLSSCTERIPTEVVPINIPLSGSITDRNEEISGMDWYGDNLILLPENLNGYLFSIHESELDSRIHGRDTSAILPKKIKFLTPNYDNILPGFDSFEAIAFRGFEVYLTLEIRFPDSMGAALARGHIDENTLDVIIPEQNLIELAVPSFVDNMSYESLVIDQNTVYAFFETNGESLVNDPYALAYSLPPTTTLKMFPMFPLEYRIADATRLDSRKNFWVINYFYPGDRETIKPSKDILAVKHGEGPTHSVSDRVERLVEFRLKDKKIDLTNRAPLELRLEGEKTSRKWEALARYDNEGFLIATDKYPTTILAFIPFSSH